MTFGAHVLEHYDSGSMQRISARQRVFQQPLTGALIHKAMSRIFPKKNDYGSGSFEELVPELARFGIATLGQFRSLMTKHRRAMLASDRIRLSPQEIRSYSEWYGEAYMKDAVRRQYLFAYPAFVRTAAKLQFGEEASVYETSATIRVLTASEWKQYRDIRLRSLADSPDAFGSTLALETDRSDEAWQARLSAAASSGKDLPLVAEQDGAMVGLVWAKVDAADDSVVNAFQMWVALGRRGQGTGRLLLDAVIDWAKLRNARCVQLRVAFGDSPAVRLYDRAGFKVFGALEPLRSASSLMAQSMQLLLRDAED